MRFTLDGTTTAIATHPTDVTGVGSAHCRASMPPSCTVRARSAAPSLR
ncbi:hypothetical protein [Micromonospora sp. NPDC000668]